jgi:hypothetical protein
MEKELPVIRNVTLCFILPAFLTALTLLTRQLSIYPGLYRWSDVLTLQYQWLHSHNNYLVWALAQHHVWRKSQCAINLSFAHEKLQLGQWGLCFQQCVKSFITQSYTSNEYPVFQWNPFWFHWYMTPLCSDIVFLTRRQQYDDRRRRDDDETTWWQQDDDETGNGWDVDGFNQKYRGFADR